MTGSPRKGRKVSFEQDGATQGADPWDQVSALRFTIDPPYGGGVLVDFTTLRPRGLALAFARGLFSLVAPRGPIIVRTTVKAYLRSALPDAHILAQVSMGALLAPARGLNRSQAQSWRNRYNQKIVDFVAINPRTGAVLALIELDDRFHSARRDTQRDCGSRRAGLPRAGNIANPDTGPLRRGHRHLAATLWRRRHTADNGVFPKPPPPAGQPHRRARAVECSLGTMGRRSNRRAEAHRSHGRARSGGTSWGWLTGTTCANGPAHACANPQHGDHRSHHEGPRRKVLKGEGDFRDRHLKGEDR